jgi:hypothetical protein
MFGFCFSFLIDAGTDSLYIMDGRTGKEKAISTKSFK